MLPDAAAAHYAEQRGITADVLGIAADIWGTRPPRDFDAWFDANIGMLMELVTAGQGRAMAGSGEYVADALDELGISGVAPESAVETAALVGVASDGRALDSLMYGAVITSKGQVAGGASTSQAWESGLSSLLTRLQVQVADASRAATSLHIASRRGVGYVRMLNPPSCSRCVVLAGRFYRYNQGFDRHPGCDCRHIPANEDRAGDLRTDPRLYFESRSAAQQDKEFTIAGAQAIRDGADMSQVVNARRGMSTAQVNLAGWIPKGKLSTENVYGQSVATTDEGVTRLGVAYQAMSMAGYAERSTDVRGRRYFKAKAPRLMPETIYQIAEDRPDALRLLKLYGYMSDDVAPQRAASVKLSPKAGDGKSIWQTREELAAAKAAASSAGNSSVVRKLVEPEISPNVVGLEKMQFERDFAMVPKAAKEILEERGVEIVVARKVSESKFAELFKDMRTDDGRAVEDLSFYQDSLSAVVITTGHESGSVNVVAHEIGHALDSRTLRGNPVDVVWQEQGSEHLPTSIKQRIQEPDVTTVDRFIDDPYVEWAHSAFIHKNPAANAYYRTGSEGHAQSGREEWVAEGYAAVVERNDAWLLTISGGSREAADILKWTYRRMGVLP
ncbi:VG15 protein [Rhodococcus qingshengii]|uniref:VG15 protein n=1 Tax=Rhodococcus qingshengii TaxID=334542 RepID=UPI001ADEEA6B|nr:hypothetical protein [Rhodococcus qingshengii]MCQ4148685.1 hypothetical protein [Rhodococcus qingshengii]